MRLFLLLLLLLSPLVSFAQGQGSGAFCLVRDERTLCNYPTIERCHSVATANGGYCRENYTLYGNKGNSRFCIASKYGLRCSYATKLSCVRSPMAQSGEGACVENYMLTAKRLKEAEEEVDCDPDDVSCQAGSLVQEKAPPPPPPPDLEPLPEF